KVLSHLDKVAQKNCGYPMIRISRLTALLKVSCTASLVTRTSSRTMQKCKFHEDQASVVGPLLKISRSTHSASLVTPSNHGNDEMMPTREGSPMSCDLTGTVQVQKRKFHEDQDSAVGPPLKISRGTRGTSLVIPLNHGNNDPIPCDRTVQDFALDLPPEVSRAASLVIQTSSRTMQKRKFHEDQGSALGPPLKISRNTRSTSLVISLNHENGGIPAGEGSSIPCDLTCISQKCKICEDQDSAVGPPPKISRGTSLVIQPSSLIIPSLKRKVNEHRDLALGPPPKIPRTTSVANLVNRFPRGNSCVIWKLPNELLGKIAALLPQDSLLALTQVCQLLREIAAPHYFALLEFKLPRSNYLSLDNNGCEALFVWRRTEAFVVPTSVHFSVSRTTTDYHLDALRMFFESLTGGKLVPRMHLLLYSGPDKLTVSFLRMLESIRGSGCKELTCNGFAWVEGPRSYRAEGTLPPISICNTELQVLQLSSSLFFTPSSIAFTLTTLRSAPLISLRLTNTGLTAVQWTSFLNSLRFTYLRTLEIETVCPTRTLVDFLSHHQVDALTIISAARLSLPPRSPLRRTRPMTQLSSLARLDGSPSYILSLLHYAHIPGILEYLGVRLEASSFTDCYLSDVLSCVEHLTGVGELFIRIPAEADPRALVSLENSSRPCPVKVRDLTFWVLHSKPDDNTIVRRLHPLQSWYLGIRD
ncbi:hypothetical protein EDC04DRAFT_2617656, partial [Pisolithus marmoratus]